MDYTGHVRSRSILVKLNQKERKVLEETANALNLSMNATIRHLLSKEHRRLRLDREKPANQKRR